ncbi:MAG: hypothetical protein WA892_04345 [Ornithinimicrobium sp.]
MTMFVQLIEFTSNHHAELKDLANEWTRDAMGEGTVLRATLGRHVDAGDRYVWIVYFESADEATRNSTRPETGGYAQRLQEMCSEGPTFADLDVFAHWPH